MAPGKTIILGNGINRCFNKSSWENIIEEIIGRFSTGLTYGEIDKLPYNMQIVAASGDHVDDAMKEYCDYLNADIICEENRKMLIRLISGYDDILTTNYSFEIEQALGIKSTIPSYRKISHQTIMNLKDSQKKTNIYKYHDAGGKRIWHIHGDIAAPRSVVMGHYYYGKLVHSIQNRIPNFMREFKRCESKNEPFNPKSWVDIFMLNNVTIIGCALDLCEHDLYYLFCCKKRNFSDTVVTFVVPSCEEINFEKEILLNAYGVKIVRIDSPDYKSFYYKAIDYLK